MEGTKQITIAEAGAILAEDPVFMGGLMNAFRLATEICARLDAEEAKRQKEKEEGVIGEKEKPTNQQQAAPGGSKPKTASRKTKKRPQDGHLVSAHQQTN